MASFSIGCCPRRLYKSFGVLNQESDLNMGNFRCSTIHKQDDHGSSAFLFDLRNSTKIIRCISYDERLQYHINYMRDLHKFIYSTIYGKYSTGSDKDEFAINDTGDGYLCAFWSKNHSLDCMGQAIEIKKYLQKSLSKHNDKLELKKEGPRLDFGFAIHTGGLTVERVNFNDKGGRLIHKDFILGILPNAVAKLEKLNKLFIEYNFVASGNYKSCFSNQADNIGNSELKKLFNDTSQFVHKLPGRVNIDDGKPEGHYVYTIDDSYFQEFKKLYP